MAALLGLRSWADGERTDVSRARALQRIELARLAIDATSAELECERQRAEQAAIALSRSKSSQSQALTIASILAASATSIASVLLATRNANEVVQDGVAIEGGAATAALALASLYVDPRTPFGHSRNLLADIWQAPASSRLYPSLVWTYLMRPEFSNDGRKSIRDHLVARWQRDAGLEGGGPLPKLLFGSGGRYDVDGLHLRAEMLDEVEAEVRLESQDLAAFAARVLRD